MAPQQQPPPPPPPPPLLRGPSLQNPHGGPMGYQPGLEKIPTTEMRSASEEAPPGPPEEVYPCGCAYPGTHKPDCMWSLWEQMRDNYVQTRTLMGKFMSQVNTMQDSANEGVKCECPAGCHGTDLGTAMGLQQMTGVTVPWNMALGGPASLGGLGGLASLGGSGAAPVQSYPVQNEARKMMEEQRRIKNTWVQFLNIFDMALDLANDVSKDRWEQNRRRKERQRLEREQRLEEMRKERLERQKGSKPEPPQEKKKPSNKKDEENEGEEEETQETEKTEKKDQQTAAAEDEPEETNPEEPAEAEPAEAEPADEGEPTPEAGQQAEEEGEQQEEQQ